MAAASDIAVHFVIPTPCSLCDGDEDVNSFCKECHQYLCDRCKRLHDKSPFLQNHHLVPYTEGYKIKGDHCNVICDNHKERFTVFCQTCSRHICTKCLTSQSHKGHEYTDIQTYAQNVTARIQTKIAEKTTENDSLTKKIRKVSEGNKTAMQQCEDDIQEIRKNVKALVDEAKKIEKEMTDIVIQRKDEIGEEDKIMNDKIASTTSSNQHRLTDISNSLQRQSDISVVDYEREAIAALQQIQISPLPGPIDVSSKRFTPGTLDITCLRDMIGHMGTLSTQKTVTEHCRCKLREKIKTINSFSVIEGDRSGSVFWCLNVNDNKVYACIKNYTGTIDDSFDESKVVIFDGMGNRTDTVSVYKGPNYPNHIACTAEKVFVSFSVPHILQVSLKEKCVTKFAKLNEGDPGPIVITADNSILVVVQNVKKPIPMIHKFSFTGKMIQKIDLTSTVNDSNQACISDIVSYVDGQFLVRYKEKILILDRKFALINSFSLSDSWKISSRCFSCDKYGHIICANSNGGIFLLNKTGNLMQQYQIPLSNKEYIKCIAVDAQCQLWLGTNQGNIIIASYLL